MQHMYMVMHVYAARKGRNQFRLRRCFRPWMQASTMKLTYLNREAKKEHFGLVGSIAYARHERSFWPFAYNLLIFSMSPYIPWQFCFLLLASLGFLPTLIDAPK